MTDDEIIEEMTKAKKNYNPTNQDIFSEQAGLTNQRVASNDQEFDEAKNNKTLNCQELVIIFKKVGFFYLNIGSVYFFEYMCLTSFADRFVAKMLL